MPPTLDETRLDQFSTSILFMARQLFACRSAVFRNNPFNPLTLMIEIPCPRSPVTPLVITTYERRITVFFDNAHYHADTIDDSPDDQFDRARAFVEKIISEDLVVAIRLKEGNVTRSAIFEPTHLEKLRPGKYTYVRSWLGTFDREW